MDLGASPMAAQRRVILPMLVPAIVASAVLVFADVIDDFVIVRYLSGDSSTEPTSVKIYNTARAAPTPALNALATLMLVAAMLDRRRRVPDLPLAEPAVPATVSRSGRSPARRRSPRPRNR